LVASSGQPGIKDRAVPISAVSFLVLLIGPAVSARVAHSAWLATIRTGEASGLRVLSGAIFRFKLRWRFAACLHWLRSVASLTSSASSPLRGRTHFVRRCAGR
jgi:hypothetical protein